MTCFNPCFNGSWVQILLTNRCHYPIQFGFNPCFNGSWVQIAMISTDGHRLAYSFNPCFNGSWVQILSHALLKHLSL
ncbi:hypothetical protein MCHI_000472 [Candidatus Magnetoovum chiemensis]|nr:hypothetical protein MCHI_000472 [Candidatus Magnetoovum chiemensis]